MKSLPESSAGEGTPAKNHLAWIDLLRVVAIFQVILIHVSFPVIGKEELSQSYRLAANFYDAFSRASVPLFFMVSGYLLLGRDEPVTNFLYRRFVKVGIPAVAWTAVYLIRHQEAYRDGSMNILRIGLSMVKAVFGGHFEIHLWFVYVLMGLYLAMPILRVLVSSSPFLLNYFLALWLLANPFFSLLGRISGETVDASLRLFLVEGYAGFLVLGYVLGQRTLPARGRWVALITFLAAAFAVYAGTNALSAQAGYFDDFLYDYLGFPVILMSASFFLWFKSLDKVLSGRRMSFLKHLSDASFGIYLVHILVQEGLRKGWFGFSLYSWMGPPIYMIPLTGLAVFMISFGIVFVIKRIPVLKYAV